MRGEDRKAAITAYKQRKTVAGIYAMRCSVTAECWVGAAPDLETIQNRLWFGLRLGTSHNADLKAAYDAHGPDGIAYQELERLDEEKDPYIRGKKLQERLSYWRTTLNAKTV